jgi:hypothetical protein
LTENVAPLGEVQIEIKLGHVRAFIEIRESEVTKAQSPATGRPPSNADTCYFPPHLSRVYYVNALEPTSPSQIMVYKFQYRKPLEVGSEGVTRSIASGWEGVMDAKSGYLIGNELITPMKYGDLFLLGNSDNKR